MLCDQPIQEPVLALLPAKPVLQAIQIATPGLFSLELQADAMFCYAVGHGADHSPTLHDRRNSLGSRGCPRAWIAPTMVWIALGAQYGGLLLQLAALTLSCRKQLIASWYAQLVRRSA